MANVKTRQLIELEGSPVQTVEASDTQKVMLENFQKEVVSGIETKLEAKKSEISSGIKTELETSMKEELDAKIASLKQELIELQKASSNSNSQSMTDIEKVQLQRLNSCIKQGEKPVTLEQLREYNDKLTLQVRSAVRGEQVKLDATIAGFAGFDDAKGGALIVPEYDKNIYQDFEEYDEGLFNSINFENAMSRTKKVVIDTVEPDENVQAVKETLSKINYTLDDGGLVQATLNLKDYDNPAKITYDEIEDNAFRVENYVNGKLVAGARRKIAKDLWVGNSSESIKGLINYEAPADDEEAHYGQIRRVHVAANNTVTMDDIMNLCTQNRNKGVLFIDRATWGKCIAEKDNNGRFKFELGYVQRDMAGARPFHVDAYVPLFGVPVVFDDAFTLPEAVAANVVAAILPPSAVAGYKQPTGRLRVKDDLKYREMLLTERYDAVVRQFKYVRLLIGTQA